jgi:hypothetical protein
VTLADAYSTAISRETDWFRADESASGLATLTGPGLFATVGGYPHDINRRQRELFLWRDAVEYRRVGAGGQVGLLHHMVATVKWPLSRTASAAAVDQAALDTALGLVVMRIAGLFQDKTHGQRFAEAGDTDGIRFDYSDPNMVEKDERLQVAIHYTAEDILVG